MEKNQFRKTIEVGQKKITVFDINRLEEAMSVPNIDRLPFSIKILVENLLRKLDGRIVTEKEPFKHCNMEKTIRYARGNTVSSGTRSYAGFYRGPGGRGSGSHA